MIARLSRIVPLLIILAVVAGIVYLVVAWRHSPNRAKEVLIKVFTVLTSVLSGFFALVTLYALFEHNNVVFDLALSFLITTLIGLVVTRICRAVFVKHHPGWGKKRQRATRIGNGPKWPWQR